MVFNVDPADGYRGPGAGVGGPVAADGRAAHGCRVGVRAPRSILEANCAVQSDPPVSRKKCGTLCGTCHAGHPFHCDDAIESATAGDQHG